MRRNRSSEDDSDSALTSFIMLASLLLPHSGAAGDPGVPGLAAGSGERHQGSQLTGQAHGVPLVRSRQGSLRVGLLQQLGHKNPPKPKVCERPWVPSDCVPNRSRSLWTRSQNNFVAIVDLPEGEHQYKFSVDGHWMLDPNGVSGRCGQARPAEPQRR